MSRGSTPTVLDHARTIEVVQRLIGQYMAQGVPPQQIDMDGFREQLADRLACQLPATMRDDYTVHPEDVHVRVLTDVTSQQAHFRVAKVPIRLK